MANSTDYQAFLYFNNIVSQKHTLDDETTWNLEKQSFIYYWSQLKILSAH